MNGKGGGKQLFLNRILLESCLERGGVENHGFSIESSQLCKLLCQPTITLASESVSNRPPLGGVLKIPPTPTDPEVKGVRTLTA